MKFNSQITFFGVADIHRTAQFYEKVLGLELVVDQGTCRIYRSAGNAYVGFCEHLEQEAKEGLILTFVTDKVDEWFSRLKEQDLAVDKEPAHNEKYGIYHCFVRDPDGYRIEIQRFDDLNWNK